MQVLETSEAMIADGKIVGRSPRDGGELEPVDVTSSDEILRVVAAAREAQRVWAEHTPRDRAKRLKKLSGAVLERGDRFAEIKAAEQGKSAVETYTSEVLPSADLFSYWASQAPKLLVPDAASLKPDQLPAQGGHHRADPEGRRGTDHAVGTIRCRSRYARSCRHSQRQRRRAQTIGIRGARRRRDRGAL